MKIAAALGAIGVALALQATAAGFVLRGAVALDLVLIVVVHIALSSGPVAGLLAGSVAGLVQDALSSGVVGIGGLAKTLVGFLAGVVGAQFIVTAPLPRFLVFALATLLHAVVFMGVYVLLELRQFPSPYAAVLAQSFGNGLVGVVSFHVIDWLPELIARRRAAKPLKR